MWLRVTVRADYLVDPVPVPLWRAAAGLPACAAPTAYTHRIHVVGYLAHHRAYIGSGDPLLYQTTRSHPKLTAISGGCPHGNICLRYVEGHLPCQSYLHQQGIPAPPAPL